MSTKRKVSVAQYIAQQIALSEKSQKDIAAEIGYDKPNVLSMIKQGQTKLPVNKVGPLAKALGIDPVHLLRLTLQEYMPETWDAIQDIVGQSLVSAGEKKLLDELRAALGGIGLDDLSPKSRERLAAVLKELATDERKGRESAVRAVRPKRA
jgi:predicted nucleic acid-binding OB-fold protein